MRCSFPHVKFGITQSVFKQLRKIPALMLVLNISEMTGSRLTVARIYESWVNGIEVLSGFEIRLYMISKYM